MAFAATNPHMQRTPEDTNDNNVSSAGITSPSIHTSHLVVRR